MKILFLDYDGVINSTEYFRNRPDEDNRPHPLSEFDPIAIGHLNQICLQTGSKVVVSSDWRHGKTIQELQNILYKCGFVGEIIGVTQSLSHHGNYIVRGNEILKWIEDNNDVEEYLILDDTNDMLLRQKDNFIHVDRSVGITSQTVSMAIKILNNK